MLIAAFNIEDGLRGLCAWLCKLIYWLIGGIFELFINVSKVELLSSDNIKPIYQRVTIVLAIVMVFYVTFELVKYIVQPDQMTDKEKGADKVVTKMIIVVLLIAFVPTVFSYSYKLQNIVIEKEILPKLILGKSGVDTTTYGRNFSADIFTLFYQYDKNFWNDQSGSKMCEGVSYENIVLGNLESMRTDGSFSNLTHCLNKSEKETKNGVKSTYYLITFNGLLAVLVGAFLVYVLILYCIDVGTRVAQLAFLQIIAPIPIIGYLSPKKENIFTKWVKQCLTTYLDLFIRLAIIYFVLLVCSVITTAYNNGTLFNNLSASSSRMLIYIVLILGLLLFAQKAPKMLQELFPKMGAASGNLGLKAGERVAPAAARVIGVGVGAARVGVRAGIAKGRNVSKRNKDLKEKLRAEGKHVDRRSMSEARKEARKQERQTRSAYKDRTRQLDKADKRVADAERDVKFSERQLERARKSGNYEQINFYEKQLKENQEKHRMAKEHYDSVRSGAKGSLNSDSVRNTGESLERATTNLNRAKKAKADAIANGTYEGMRERLDGDIATAENEYDRAYRAHENAKRMDESLVSKKTRENLKNAREEYDRARMSGASEEEMKPLQDKLNAAESQYINELNSGYDVSKRAHDDAKSELATQRNQTYGAYAGVQAVGAGLRGLATGAKAGFQATKLNEVGKKVNEGLKTVNDRAAAANQYLQDGGSATFTGVVDRTLAHQQQRMGIRTESERIKEEIKHIEDKAKSIGAQASMEETVRTSKDDAKDRSSKKIELKEQKIRISDKLDDIKSSNGETLVKWEEELPNYMNMTTSDVYNEYEKREATAISAADAANQALTHAKMSGASEDEILRKQSEAERLSSEAEIAKNKKTQVLKKLAEYGVTKALQGDTSDAVLANKITTLKASIENARNNASSRQTVLDELARRRTAGIINEEKYQRCVSAFINNDVSDWDTADTIEGILTGHVGMLKNDQRSLQEQVRAIQENAATDAANAAAAGGGKK